MKKPKPPRRNGVRRDVKPEEWLEIKWEGKTYLVAVLSLLEAYKAANTNG